MSTHIDSELSNKVAIITGGGSGIGLATALFLAQKGCSLVLLGRNTEQLKTAEAEINALSIPNVTVKTYACDITKDAEVINTFELIAKDFKQINYLVNNAGVNTYTTLEKITDTEIDLEIDVKSKGIIFCTRAAIPLMPKGSAIVDITSVNAFLGGKTSPAYPASNGVANTLTKYFSVNLVSKSIRVNAVAPGLVYPTGFTKNIPAEKIMEMAKANPMGRLCAPEDIAKTIYFLLSDLSAYITGQTLHVNGGYFMN